MSAQGSQPAKPGGKRVVPISPGVEVDAFRRGDHTEIAERVLRKLGPDPITYDAGEFWRYSGPSGVWEVVPDHVVRDTVTGFAGAPLLRGDDGMLLVGASTAAGVEQVIRDRLRSAPGRVEFSAAPAGITFADGFVQVRAGGISVLPLSPAHLARYRYEFKYTPKAPHPKLDAFLDALVADVTDATERAQRIALIQEYLGICLIGEATKYQRYLVIYATGGNGKSELLRIARAMFPAGTVTSLEPQLWRDMHAAAALITARANFVDELPDDEIMGGHNVKRVITGEPITVRRVYKDAVTFSPRAGHIFATNVEVQSTDYSDGFWERPLVLVLSRKFRKDASRVLEAARPIIDAELPAIVAWAIEGAARVQRQGGYTIPGSSASTLLEWRDDNDQVRSFVADKPITGRWAALSLYEEYRTWAKASGCAIMSAAKFGRRIVANGLAKRGRDAQGRYYLPAGDAPNDPEAIARAALEAEAERIAELERCG